MHPRKLRQLFTDPSPATSGGTETNATLVWSRGRVMKFFCFFVQRLRPARLNPITLLLIHPHIRISASPKAQSYVLSNVLGDSSDSDIYQMLVDQVKRRCRGLSWWCTHRNIPSAFVGMFWWILCQYEPLNVQNGDPIHR